MTRDKDCRVIAELADLQHTVAILGSPDCFADVRKAFMQVFLHCQQLMGLAIDVRDPLALT